MSFSLAFALIASATTQAPAAEPTVADMAGDWVVDLRLKLDDPVYTQPMQLAIAADGVATGSFYQSEILAGRAGAAQGRVCVAFRTTDGQGIYHTSACLADGKMVGQTWAEARNFVLPWTAERP